MIEQLTYIETDNTHPYKNLAVEEYLLLHCRENECILYLWQNQNTVVAGRNQNVWKECLVSRLEEDNGHIVRRLSGGMEQSIMIWKSQFYISCTKRKL